MAVRKEHAREWVDQGYPVGLVLKVLGVAHSSYYYISRDGKRGRRPSTQTVNKDGRCVNNTQILAEIEALLGQEFVDYGYLKVKHWLTKRKGYLINAKKVYRLMKEGELLYQPQSKRRSKRQWVKDLLPKTNQPFDYLELDFKTFYIGARKALLLTVIDVHSRWVLGHLLAWKMSQKQVQILFEQLLAVYPMPKKYTIRTDNGMQFEGLQIQHYLSEQKGLTHEFCLPATPEQNAHIESYHSILERTVSSQNFFSDLNDCQQILNRFVQFYNYERIHSGVEYDCPYNFLKTLQIDMKKYNLTIPLDCKQFKATC